MLDSDLAALIVGLHGNIQITAMEQQSSSLRGDAHAMDLNLRPSRFGGSAKHAIRIEHDESGRVIPVADSSGDDLLPSVSVKVGHGDVRQMSRMPILGDRLAVRIDDRYLIGILGHMGA